MSNNNAYIQPQTTYLSFWDQIYLKVQNSDYLKLRFGAVFFTIHKLSSSP